MPIKSSSGLTRCPSCRAHVRAAETPAQTVCPFCGATGRATAHVVHAGRSGLLAASLLALSACGGPETEPPTNQNTEPTVTEQPTGGDEEQPGDPPDDPEPTYRPPADDPTAVEAYGMPPDDPGVSVPAYGVAPPPQQP